MSNRAAFLALVLAMAAAGGYAVLRPSTSANSNELPTSRAVERVPGRPIGPRHATSAEAEDAPQMLPPGHPPVDASAAPRPWSAVGATGGPSAVGATGGPSAVGATGSASGGGETGTLSWTIPDGWKSAPNPSNMRLATYRIPHGSTVAEDAELSISRAGGNVDANLQRWVGQFEDSDKDTRTSRTVGALKVTTVEVSGTFVAGTMMGAATKKPGWSLLGAIVEMPVGSTGGSSAGSSYFFKLTGPTATVKSARAAFQKMLDSLTIHS